MKIKVEDKGISRHLGVFAEEIKGKEYAIFSIISSERNLVEEEHIVLLKEQAIIFLKKALKEIKENKWKSKS